MLLPTFIGVVILIIVPYWIGLLGELIGIVNVKTFGAKWSFGILVELVLVLCYFAGSALLSIFGKG